MAKDGCPSSFAPCCWRCTRCCWPIPPQPTPQRSTNPPISPPELNTGDGTISPFTASARRCCGSGPRFPPFSPHAQAPPTDQRKSSAPILKRHWLYADAFIAANFARFAVSAAAGAAGDDSHLLLCRLGHLSLGGRVVRPSQCAAACAMYCLNPEHPGQRCTGHDRCWHRGRDVGVVLALVAILPLSFLAAVALACVAVLAASVQVHRAFCSGRCCSAMALPFVDLAACAAQWWLLPAAWIALARGNLILLNAFTASAEPAGRSGVIVRFRFHEACSRSSRRPISESAAAAACRGFRRQRPTRRVDTRRFPSANLSRDAMVLLPGGAALQVAPSRCSCFSRRRWRPAACAEPRLPARGGEWSLFLACRRLRRRGHVPWRSQHRHAISSVRVSAGVYLDFADCGRSSPSPARRTRRSFPIFAMRCWPFWRWKHFWVCPRFLTFVNFAVGGPSNGWRLLSDSDFDWGQG